MLRLYSSSWSRSTIVSALFFVPNAVVVALAPAGPWDEFNYAPASRTVWPKSVFKTEGSVTGPEQLVGNAGAATFAANGAYVSLDFGLEIGGIVSLNFDSVTTSSNVVLAFSESSVYVRPDASDDSTLPAASTRYDLVQNLNTPLQAGRWTQPIETLRGGFRYLTLTSTGADPITISNVSCTINFMPHIDDLRAYKGYFYARDPTDARDADFLNKIWYAGAYTVQTNTVRTIRDAGSEAHTPRKKGWRNDAIAGVEGPLMVDGAKRDRAVWPGDMGVAVPTAFVSTGDLLATRNSLDTMLTQIDVSTGELPESGPPLNARGSDTYQAWTLIGAHGYVLFSGDSDWMQANWERYKFAAGFLTRKIVAETGLMDVTGRPDWALLDRGGQNPKATRCCTRSDISPHLITAVLINGAELADLVEDVDTAASYRTQAASLKDAYNRILWDDGAGLYRDNAASSMYPQDGNALAILYNLTTSHEQALRVSEGLTKNWNDIGPVTPEVADTISPFISSFELQAHFMLGQDERALDLTRRLWGFLLYDPSMTGSTLIEGISANGSLAYRANFGYENDPSFVSHSHGWSTGPTSALTFYVLGLRITSPQGKTWEFDPHTSGLPSAEGGFETALGWFGVEWSISDDGVFTAEVVAPTGTDGVINLDHVSAAAQSKTVKVNGKVAVGVPVKCKRSRRRH
ncbi:Six-hairpin glycosidase [Auriculariales sp. MPI-PUGE-AT-0066]|nr:Six-hairpin glycosidase [Auriculariales sp. MPI-PUGE-AT-0066]